MIIHIFFKACMKIKQENKSSKKIQYINEFKEHNYFSTPEDSITQSCKKQHTERCVHTSDCIINKKPITINILKEALSEKENNTLDFDPVQNINTEITSEIVHGKFAYIRRI